MLYCEGQHRKHSLAVADIQRVFKETFDSGGSASGGGTASSRRIQLTSPAFPDCTHTLPVRGEITHVLSGNFQRPDFFCSSAGEEVEDEPKWSEICAPLRGVRLRAAVRREMGSGLDAGELVGAERTVGTRRTKRLIDQLADTCFYSLCNTLMCVMSHLKNK